MKFTNRVTVTGMKPSKGVMENGMAYDSTKVYVMTELDGAKGSGCATVEYSFLLSDEYAKYKHLFPGANSITAECDFEQITNGKVQSTRINAVRPVSGANAMPTPKV